MAKFKLAYVGNDHIRDRGGRHCIGYRLFIDDAQGPFARSARVEYTKILVPRDTVIPADDLHEYDAIIWGDMDNPQIDGIEKLSAVKVLRGPHIRCMTTVWQNRFRECGISFVYFQAPRHRVYRKPLGIGGYDKITGLFSHREYSLDRDIDYRMIFMGADPDVFHSGDFDSRRSDKILCTGAMGLFSVFYHYRLRYLTRGCEHVVYNERHRSKYHGLRYPKLLNQYQGAIAACTTHPVLKFIQIPMCGCVAFMEVTRENCAKHLGFKDGETAVFIKERNYRRKFAEFIQDIDNPKWKRIAEQGRQFAIEEYSNEAQANKMMDYIEEYL